MGTRITDAAMERHLLVLEVKAARVRKAEDVKRGVVRDSGKKYTSCPSCKPLQEANLELQRVASRRRQKKSGRRDSYNFGGVSSFDDGSEVDLTPAVLKSRYGGRTGMPAAIEDDRDDASISSTESGREADFVKRFLGKVTKNSTTLRGTISKLGPTAKFGSSPLNDTLSRFRTASATDTSTESSRRAPTSGPFDDLITSALSISNLQSGASARDKSKRDEALVKR